MRRLIICCDGTWCDPDVESVTNVGRFYNALSDQDSSGRRQLACYQPGVGTTGGVLRRMLGGAVGSGLSDDVMAAYQWLATTYSPGDAVALVGFSRGAYTVRSLAGLVGASGLVDLRERLAAEAGKLVARAYRHYRARDDSPEWREGLAFRYDPRSGGEFPIDFLGVWDTVGSLGVPGYFTGLNLLDPPDRYRFHDMKLNPRIKHGRHALALDERRRPFTPTRWVAPEPGQDIEERWFPGSHMDVGGGHRETALSDRGLQWMIGEAEKHAGLGFHRASVQALSPDPAGLLHNDDRGVFGVLPTVVEPLMQPILEAALQYRPRAVPRVTAEVAEIDPSAVERRRAQPITGGRYRPTQVLAPGESASVGVAAHELWHDTGLYLEPGHYRFSASGQWYDGTGWSGPEGRAVAGLLRHVVGSVLALGLRWYRRLPGQDVAYAPLAPREVDLPWMSLVGYVANDAHPCPGAPNGREHQRIAIGAGAGCEVRSPGYCYAFANDAWGRYGTNRGTVTLTVSRDS
ncbi:DUF2235 domain-containing protein [Amycolatopsis dongchuanensis]|uniref:T6SS Phospholipase effector Tle1-like catalytic domain-containing protein n=1 Tax=Amycolatopsis dongchuanensis TaxID=1070866 RepID=A0ABP9QVK7_9PSEU